MEEKEKSSLEALEFLQNKLPELHESGALETIFELITLTHSIKMAITDDLIERGSSYLENIQGTLGKESSLETINSVVNAIQYAVDQQGECDQGFSLLESLKMLRDPEIRRAVRFAADFTSFLSKARK